MSKKQLTDLPKRALTTLIAALLLFGLIFFAQVPGFKPVFTGAVAIISAIALWEYQQLLKRKGLSPATLLSIIASVLYIFSLLFKTSGSFASPFWQNLPEIILGATFFACFAYFAITGNSPLLNIATTFFGILYIAVPLGLTVKIAYFFTFGGMHDLFSTGSWWLFYLLAVTKSADMGGYFIGRFFGKRKLAFRLSPNKTLEGAIGGLILSLLVALLITYLAKTLGGAFRELSYVAAGSLGLLVGALGQMGDLAESLLKRDVGVKDSNTLPGVGGMLDMVDSLLFTTPIVYIFLKIYYS